MTLSGLRVFLISPWPAALFGGIMSWATGAFPRPVSMIVFYVLLLYGVQLLLGVFIHRYLVRTGAQSPLAYLLGGVLMVAVVVVPYVIWASNKNGYTVGYVLPVLAVWLIMGAITGLTANRLMRSRLAPGVR